MNKIISEIQKFNMDSNVHALRERYENVSLLEMFSISRREMSHSSFLANLLKEDSFHGLGNRPLQLFLEVVLKRALMQDTKKLCSKGNRVMFTEMKNAILTQQIDPTDIEVDSEKDFRDPSLGNSGRVDILVKCHINPVEREGRKNKTVRFLNIIIENKIYANEQDEQTEKYYKHFDALLHNNAQDKVKVEDDGIGPRGKYNIYVYLTPMDSDKLDVLKEPVCKCKEFVQINYQDILDGVINPLLNNCKLNDRAHFILEEYKHSLGVSFTDVEQNNGRGQMKGFKTIIMAMDQNDSCKLVDFWNTYKKLLIASVTEFNRENDEDDNSTNGRMQYDYKGQPYNMGRLVQAVIADHAKDYKMDELNRLFEDCKCKKILRCTELDRIFNNYFCDQIVMTEDCLQTYVFSNWNKNNFSLFCDIVRNLGWGDIKEYKKSIPTKEDSLLLKEFYKKHETLITTALEVIKRTSKEEEVIATFTRNRATRNRPSYTLTTSNDTKTVRGLSRGRLILAVLQDFADGNTTSKEILDQFNLDRSVLKEHQQDKLEGYSDYFIDETDRLLLADGAFVIKKGWSSDEIETFVATSSQKGYDIINNKGE